MDGGCGSSTEGKESFDAVQYKENGRDRSLLKRISQICGATFDRIISLSFYTA